MGIFLVIVSFFKGARLTNVAPESLPAFVEVSGGLIAGFAEIDVTESMLVESGGTTFSSPESLFIDVELSAGC